MRIERRNVPNYNNDGETYLVRTHVPGRTLTTETYTVRLDKSPAQGKAVQVMVWDSEDIAAISLTGANFQGFESIIRHHGYHDYGGSDWDRMRGKISVDNNDAAFSYGTVKEQFSWHNFTRSNWNHPRTVHVKVHCDDHDPALNVPIYNLAVEYNQNDLPRNDQGLYLRSSPQTGTKTKLWKLDRTSADVVYFAITDNTPPPAQLSDFGQGSDDAELPVPVDAVSNLRVSADDATTATATWDAVQHADSYIVEYYGEASDPLNDVGELVTGHPGTSWTFQHNAAESMAITVTVTPEYVDGNGDTQQLDSLAATSTFNVTVTPPAQQEVCTPNLPSDAITVSEVKSWRSDYPHASHVSRWNRVLAALGESTGESAMSADDARAIKQQIDNTRWDRTVRTLEAMEQCPTSGTSDGTDTDNPVIPPPPPPTPEVSISAGSGISEGGLATFTISANPSPSAAIDVLVSVSATGDYGVTTGPQTVRIPASGSYTLSVATSDDAVDESGRLCDGDS